MVTGSWSFSKGYIFTVFFFLTIIRDIYSICICHGPFSWLIDDLRIHHIDVRYYRISNGFPLNNNSLLLVHFAPLFHFAPLCPATPHRVQLGFASYEIIV